MSDLRIVSCKVRFRGLYLGTGACPRYGGVIGNGRRLNGLRWQSTMRIFTVLFIFAEITGCSDTSDESSDSTRQMQRTDATCFAGQDCPVHTCPGPDCELQMAQSCRQDDDCPDGEACGGEIWFNSCVKACEVKRTCPRRPRTCSADSRCPEHLICQRQVCIPQCSTDQIVQASIA